MDLNSVLLRQDFGLYVAACTDSKKETFQIRLYKPSLIQPYFLLWHKEFTLGTAFAEFLETDLSKLVADLSIFQKYDEDIYYGKPRDFRDSAMKEIISYWNGQSAFFAPFVAAAHQFFCNYIAVNPVDVAILERQVAYYLDIQPKLKHLAHVLFEEGIDDTLPPKVQYMHLHRKDPIQFPALQCSELRLEYIATRDQPYLFDWSKREAFDWQKEPLQLQDVICTQAPASLVNFMLYRYLNSNLELRTCKFCNRYFGTKKGSKGEYCNRLVENSAKTCREVGSARLYEKRNLQVPAQKEYKRSYKAHNARIRYGIMTKEEFAAWAEEARNKRDECLAGELSLKDFVAWLDSDKR